MRISTLQRVGLGLLTLSLTAAMATPAWAVEPVAGLDYADLYIHKYLLTNISEAGQPGNGTPVTPPASAEPVQGMHFDIYQIDITSCDVDSLAGHHYKVTGDTMTVTNTLNEVVATCPLVGQTPIVLESDETGTAVQLRLGRGVYVVVENLEASLADGTPPTDPEGNPVNISRQASPFLVAIPMTNPEGTGYLAEIHVYPKDEALKVTKTVDVDAAHSVVVGQTVTYTIESSVPEGVEKEKAEYWLTDRLDEALTFDITQAFRATGEGCEVTLTQGSDYLGAFEARVMTVRFSAAGRAKLAPCATVKFSFDTTINSRILEAMRQDYTIENEADLHIVNQDGGGFTAGTNGEGSDIHTAAIEIVKQGENGAALAGASFKIATSAEAALARQFIKENSVTRELVDSSQVTGSQLPDYVVTTDAQGKARFEGIRDVVVNADGQPEGQTYYLVEVKAPTGYNLLTDPVGVLFTDDCSETGHVRVQLVENRRGFVLPQTGGMGTVVFTIAGIVLLGAAVILVVSRRKSTRD